MTGKSGKVDGWELSGPAVFADPQPRRGLGCRFLLNADGEVTSFTIDRTPGLVGEDGRVRLTPRGEGSLLGPADPDGRLLGEPITATLLRRLKFAESLRAAKEASVGWAETFGGGQREVDHLEELDAILDRRRGAARLDDVYYANVAAAYVEAFEGGSLSPTADLADRLRLSTGTARNHVREARRRRLLSPTSRGRGGGVLTERALELLRAGEVQQ